MVKILPRRMNFVPKYLQSCLKNKKSTAIDHHSPRLLFILKNSNLFLRYLFSERNSSRANDRSSCARKVHHRVLPRRHSLVHRSLPPLLQHRRSEGETGIRCLHNRRRSCLGGHRCGGNQVIQPTARRLAV